MSAPNHSITANAFAVTTAFVWTVCTAGVAMLPGPSMMMNRWWMHGSNLSNVGRWNVTPEGYLFGGLVLVVFAWLTGYVYSSSLEYFRRRK
ncbi:MAG: hypothetical protein A2804_03580 [Candidatus Pacebacteria bacterium RIFCSPHIGHO2_01_FULL_46_10]|nr:MAG: hypothetical protein A2804_03580 [Candidatus Pacebacteria bacterium RIFCSPHIGHO2_01_FULL_46_10]